MVQNCCPKLQNVVLFKVSEMIYRMWIYVKTVKKWKFWCQNEQTILDTQIVGDCNTFTVNVFAIKHVFVYVGLFSTVLGCCSAKEHWHTVAAEGHPVGEWICKAYTRQTSQDQAGAKQTHLRQVEPPTGTSVFPRYVTCSVG